jgi:hypothetical protein
MGFLELWLSSRIHAVPILYFNTQQSNASRPYLLLEKISANVIPKPAKPKVTNPFNMWMPRLPSAERHAGRKPSKATIAAKKAINNRGAMSGYRNMLARRPPLN